MAWQFGDGFDLYAVMADAINGYWDSGTVTSSLVAGRFAGSRGITTGSNGVWLTKSSGQNDAVHHIVCAWQQTSAITGAGLCMYLQLLDGVTAQCTIEFRSDGAILLASGGFGGTVLATYTGALTAANTWYAFEMEVVINNTTGRFRVRKNGNPVDDFDSGAALNTRPVSTNNYANKLSIGQTGSSLGQVMDDLYWRSDASSVPWLGDIRCYTRMPTSDASVQFSHNTGTTNFGCVDEAQQNGVTDYVFDSTVGHADFYGVAGIASTPAATIAVTTRGYMQKSDAGTRTAAVQLKSTSTTVASPTLTLTTSGFLWSWRTDIIDPATGAAWTAAAVNNAQIGPVTIA